MALDNLQIDYLIDPAFQIENLAGKPAVGGHCEVFEAGTDTKVITYQDFDGNVNPFKIPLHSDGRAVILADPSRKYDFYVYDSFNNLMFSRLNVTPNLSGNISIKGSDVYIYNTDGTLDITQQSIQNNIRRYEINTKHKSLGVEAPLYFVEDSDTATIIGFSGDDYATKDYVDSAVSSKLDISSYSSQSGDFLTDKFEYDDDNHITAYNHSAFAAGAGSGTIYEAGDHIDITNNVISVTGLPDSADVENAVNSAIEEVENKFEYNINNYITAYNNSAFAGTNYSAGDYVSIENDTISVTGLQPSGDYATRDDLTAYQPSGDYATKEDVESATSGKMDVTGMTAYQPSGDYATHDDLTAYQPVGDYYSASNPSGFITNDAITGLQPSGDYVTHDEMTAYQPSGNYATIEDVESAVSGKQDTLSAGEGIQIIDNTISVTAQGGSGITAVNHDNTLSGNGNSEPLGLANAEDYVKQDDLTGYQPSGDYYSASNPSGFITSDDLTGYATTSLVSSVSSELYSAISGISGDFELVAGSGVELVDDPNAKTTTINVTAEGTPVTAIEQMIESATSGISAAISGSYTLVAGTGIQLTDDDNARTTTVSVSGDYATTADLTAKQDTLDYGYHDAAISSIDSSALYDSSAHARINTLAGRISNLSSDKLDTTAFSDVSGSFLTAVPDTYLQNTDLTITDGKITEISGVPLSAGDELPSGVMNTSALEYNAVNEISGYNGSAIAQYGAEKQWLVHDDTIVHVSNSAQYAFGCNVSALQRLMGIDETVLWTGSVSAVNLPIVLNESLNNFNKVIFKLSMDNCDSEIVYTDYLDTRTTYGLTLNNMSNSNAYINWLKLTANESHDTLTITAAKNVSWNSTNTATAPVQSYVNWEWTCRALTKIIGVGRKEV